MLKELGQTIKTHRLKKNYTLTQLSQKLNISTGLLSNIENGKTDSFNLVLLDTLLTTLDIPIEDLEIPISYSSNTNPNLNKYIVPLTNSLSTASLTLTPSDLSLLCELLIHQIETTTYIAKKTK